MPFTFLNLKDTIRPMVWPAGEARSRRVAHDKWFVDALVEIQRYVECHQQNNTNLVPHCNTLYNCGLTSFDLTDAAGELARARIKRLSVVDAPPKDLGDVVPASVDVFRATESLPTNAWPGYPSTVNSGINNGFALSGTAPNVTYTYEVPAVVTAYTLDWFAGSGIARPTPTIPFLLEGSNDGATWTTVDSQALTINPNTARHTVTIAVTNTTAYNSYRLSVGPAGKNFQLWGIFIYGLSFSGSNLTGDIDWCSEIAYEQVDYCRVQDYFKGSAHCGHCLPVHLHFGLPLPTDEGLSPELPPLPLGYHYPQSSTDATRRAARGLWARDRGRIYIIPWLQSTETVIVKWDGIKRQYGDGDTIEQDPTLINGVLLYVLAQHEKYDNRDANQAAIAERDFNIALQGLWKDCREESMLRECEPSLARAAQSL